LQRVNGPEASEFFTTFPGIRISTDDRGCLIIQAPYLNAQIITNDLVDIIDEKSFKWLGRIDNVINTGGVKVLPEKIETEIHKILDTLSINNSFFICGIRDNALGNKLVLLVEGHLDDAAISAIKNGLKGILHPYENPKEVITNLEFVRTATGKVNRDETLRRAVI
jgi:O-succinylbenzoic acid--CoA ligase